MTKRMQANTRWLALAAAFCVALCGRAAESATSRFAEACGRAVVAAQTNGMWRWQWRGEIAADDDVFQNELREVLEAQFPLQYQEARTCSGEADAPQMAGLRNVMAQAVRATHTAERISALAAAKGFVPEVQFDLRDVTLLAGTNGTPTVGAGIRAYGRSANVADILRDSLKLLRRLGHDALVTPDNMPVSWRECPAAGRPTLDSYCQNVGGCFKYRCVCRTQPETDCPWQAKARTLGAVKEFADVDREAVWQLLARPPSAFGFEDVLKALGRPRQSITLQCSHCKKTERRWAYDIRDTDAFGNALYHVLVLTFAAEGHCTGWYWEAA